MIVAINVSSQWQQDTPYHCGPATINNALYAFDLPLDPDVLTHLNPNPVTGTSNHAMYEYWRYQPRIQATQQLHAKWHEIRRHSIVNYFDQALQEGHFALVLQRNKKHLTLLDPRYGLITIKKKDFMPVWYGGDGSRRWLLKLRRY